MSHEIETKVLDVVPDQVREKLAVLGARKVRETRLIVDWYRLPGTQEGKDPWFLRIRSDSEGRHEATWKGKPEVIGMVRAVPEVNIVVPDPEALARIFLGIGLERYAHQEKDRVSFAHEGWLFEIDRYPGMPAFLEIEGQSDEHVREGMRLLDVAGNRTWAEGERTLIQNIYGLDWYDMRF